MAGRAHEKGRLPVSPEPAQHVRRPIARFPSPIPILILSRQEKEVRTFLCPNESAAGLSGHKCAQDHVYLSSGRGGRRRRKWEEHHAGRAMAIVRAVPRDKIRLSLYKNSH